MPISFLGQVSFHVCSYEYQYTSPFSYLTPSPLRVLCFFGYQEAYNECSMTDEDNAE